MGEETFLKGCQLVPVILCILCTLFIHLFVMAFVCVCVNISISMVGWNIVFLTVLVWAFITDMIGPRWFENLMTWDYPTQTRQCYPCAYIYLFYLTFCTCANCGVHEVAQNLCHFLYVIYFYPGVPIGIFNPRSSICHFAQETLQNNT